MFPGLQPTSSGFRRHRAVAASVAAHLAVLAVIVFHNPRVIDISPAWLAFGDSAHTYKLTYFPPAESDTAPLETAKLLLPSRPAKPRPLPKPPAQKPAPEPEPLMADADAGDHNSHAGSPLGTMIDGPVTGHEVHVAYPTVFPNPPVDRDALPR